jgi:hypothetical protein
MELLRSMPVHRLRDWMGFYKLVETQTKQQILDADVAARMG